MQATVLCPDGHRVTVKFNKQTPLLTILEEACKRRKLDVNVHALRRENDRANVPNLDVSLTAMFAGLPNHCKLEVVAKPESDIGANSAAVTARQTVKIALQLEGGAGRVVGEYSSDDTLDKIVSKAKDKVQPQEGQEPVVIYMRQEVVGDADLALTSLKKLGLTAGSAVLRLLHRAPESLSEQVGFKSNGFRNSLAFVYTLYFEGQGGGREIKHCYQRRRWHEMARNAERRGRIWLKVF